MKDEIKEILRILKAKSTRYEYCLKENISYNDESYEAHILLDYITNLQEELERLKEENKSLKELNVCVGCNNNPDYKSRNEKTIELLNRHDIDTGDIYYKYNGRFVKSKLKERIREILGGDEE